MTLTRDDLDEFERAEQAVSEAWQAVFDLAKRFRRKGDTERARQVRVTAREPLANVSAALVRMRR